MDAPRPDAAPAAPLPSPTPPRRRKHRLLRFFAFLFLFVGAIAIAAPYSINLPPVRNQIAASLSREFGTHVQIDELGFSWFSGVSLDGLRVSNPKGFDPAHPAFELRRFRGDIGLSQLIQGRFQVTGKVDGLHLFVDQDASGRTNLQALAPAPVDVRVRTATRIGSGRVRSDSGFGSRLEALRLDLELTDGLLEIRRDGELLESLTEVTCSAKKEYGVDLIKVDLGTKLMRPAEPGQPGRLQIHADVDALTKAVDAQLATDGLDLAHYQPLVASFLPPGDLTALAGIVHGTLQVRVVGQGQQQRILLGGDLDVDAPHLAGACVSGMDVQSPKWSLHPELTVALGPTGSVPQIAADKFTVDLGFLQLHGLGGDELQRATQSRPGLGFHYVLDVDQLTAFGGPVPAALRNIGGRLTGTLAVPIASGALPSAKQLLADLFADAQLTSKRISIAGFALTDLDAKLQVKDGKLAVNTAPTTLLNLGSVNLTLQSDLNDLETLPFTFGLDWKGGKVDGEAADLLRFAVPLLAGLQGDAAAFSSNIDLGLHLSGPGCRRADESWLSLLNRWSGDGQLSLSGGSLAPSTPLQGLLGFVGQEGRLAIDKFGGAFTLKQGTVESKMMKWSSKGRDYGLVGKVQLDGSLDFGLDLTDVLQAHKDGQRLLAVLGPNKLLAGLKGSLTQPKLGLPDLSSLMRDAAKNELKQEGNDLLKKGLDKLLKKKDGGTPPKEPAEAPKEVPKSANPGGG
jgi:hypothetical protein